MYIIMIEGRIFGVSYSNSPSAPQMHEKWKIDKHSHPKTHTKLNKKIIIILNKNENEMKEKNLLFNNP